MDLGDNNLHAGKGNMRLIQRAIKNGWPIPDELRQKVMSQMEKIVDGGESERDRIGAAKVILAADMVNVKREDMGRQGAKDPPAGVNVLIQNNVTGGSVSVVQEGLKEPDYLEYLERRALEEDRHASPVCEDVQPGPLANGHAPAQNQPGLNGNGAHG